MLLTCDLFLVQILQATYFDEIKASDLTEEELKKHHEIYEYFGTCTRCMLSMFEITLGNWPPIARLLSEEVSEWFTLVCLAHKLTIGFAVIGVITSHLSVWLISSQLDSLSLALSQVAFCKRRSKLHKQTTSSCSDRKRWLGALCRKR